MKDDLARLVRGEPQVCAMFKVAERKLADVMELALDKMVAHLDDPKHHPLPSDKHCFERALYGLVAGKSDGDRRRLARALKDRLVPKARRKRYGDLADISLISATPVFELAKDRFRKSFTPPPPADRARIAEKFSALRQAPGEEPAEEPAENASAQRGRGKRGPIAARVTTRGAAVARFSLLIDKAQCVEKTRELFEGDDEIKLAVNLFTTDDLVAGNRQVTDILDLGTFNEGQVRGIGLQSRQVEVRASEGLPTFVAAILVIAEKDRFGANDRDLDDAEAAVLLMFAGLGMGVQAYSIVLSILGASTLTLIPISMVPMLLLGAGLTAALAVRRRLSVRPGTFRVG